MKALGAAGSGGLAETSRERVVGILRRGEATVDELATALGVTRNAARLHLAGLERDGLVHSVGVRRGATKPSRLYALTPSVELQLSRAYAPLLAQLLHVLSERFSAQEFDALMREVGRGLLAGRPHPHGSVRARAEAASALLNELGGVSEVVDDDGVLGIRGYSCPLAITTVRHPEACNAVESLLAEFTGLEVTNRCERGDRARCRFELRAGARGIPAVPPAAP